VRKQLNIVIFVTVAIGWGGGTMAASPQSPNLLIIHTDEHNFRTLGCYRALLPLEASARIPFVICFPGSIKPGTVVHEALATVDFKPTILGLMGVSSDGRTDGRDASSLLVTGKPPADWSNVAISRHAAGQWLMAVSSRYKLIVSTDAKAHPDLPRDKALDRFSLETLVDFVNGLARCARSVVAEAKVTCHV